MLLNFTSDGNFGDHSDESVPRHLEAMKNCGLLNCGSNGATFTVDEFSTSLKS